MAIEESGRPPRAPPPSPMAAVRIVPARARSAVRPEFHEGDGWLDVTFSAPDIPDGHLRHAVGRRYLLVWADDSPHDVHHLIVLPKPVDPAAAKVQFMNGVVDARIRLT